MSRGTHPEFTEFRPAGNQDLADAAAFALFSDTLTPIPRRRQPGVSTAGFVGDDPTPNPNPNPNPNPDVNPNPNPNPENGQGRGNPFFGYWQGLNQNLAKGLGLFMRFAEDPNFGGDPFNRQVWAHLLGYVATNQDNPTPLPRPHDGPPPPQGDFPPNPLLRPGEAICELPEEPASIPALWGRPFYRRSGDLYSSTRHYPGDGSDAGSESDSPEDNLFPAVNFYSRHPRFTV
jgi:hypothetical protein